MDEDQTKAEQPAPHTPTRHGKSGAKTLITILLIVVLVGVAAVIAVDHHNSKTSKSTPITNSAARAQTVATVQINSDGLVPATIQVKVGTQVNWVNNDSAQHSIAAGPIPAHSTLPDLKSPEPLNTHETFGFTFDQVGTYSYNDPLNPGKFQGTVIVVK